jgi:hypothetical protein
MKTITSILLLSFFVFPLSCNKAEETVQPNIANEALTTVQLHFVNSTNTADSTSCQWQQLLDNNGNPLPVDTTNNHLVLKTGATYHCHVIILDKTQTPVFNVTTEILQRENYHLFFYQPYPTNSAPVIPTPVSPDTYPYPIPTPIPAGNPLQLTIVRTDQDTNNPPLPVGLKTDVTVGAAGTGWLRVVLRHQPNAKNGTYAPGSSDLDVGYSVTVR